MGVVGLAVSSLFRTVLQFLVIEMKSLKDLKFLSGLHIFSLTMIRAAKLLQDEDKAVSKCPMRYKLGEISTNPYFPQLITGSGIIFDNFGLEKR